MTRFGPSAAALAAAFLVIVAPAVGRDADDARSGADARRFLVGQFLVATPKMGDPRFAESVVFMVQHDAHGAFGLIVNRVLGTGPLAGILEGLGVPAAGVDGDITLHYGGPVEPGLGFVLHSGDYVDAATIRVPGGLALSTHVAVLQAMAAGRGPERALFLLGYAGWGPHQLEDELARDDWLTAPADADIVFDGDAASKWRRAMEKAGLKL